jgi:hypothetical protein
MKAAFRRAKEKVYKYDEVVVAVRNATSSDPWNVPNSELAKIARATNDHSKVGRARVWCVWLCA